MGVSGAVIPCDKRGESGKKRGIFFALYAVQNALVMILLYLHLKSRSERVFSFGLHRSGH